MWPARVMRRRSLVIGEWEFRGLFEEGSGVVDDTEAEKAIKVVGGEEEALFGNVRLGVER